MDMAIPILVVGSLLVTGFIGTLWPSVLYNLDSEERASGPPTPEKLRSVRNASLVLVLIACVLIYAILTASGPAEGPLI
jgi:hypothetical protein